MVHWPTRGIGEGQWSFIYYGLSPYSGNPVTRVVHAVLVANLAPPAAYPWYLVPDPLAPPNKPTNFGLDQLAFCRFRLSCSSSLVHQVVLYGFSPVVFPLYEDLSANLLRYFRPASERSSNNSWLTTCTSRAYAALVVSYLEVALVCVSYITGFLLILLRTPRHFWIHRTSWPWPCGVFHYASLRYIFLPT